MAKKESKTRKRLMAQLDADLVTSRDRSGFRRFRLKESGKWGYCTDEGTVVREAKYDFAGHCIKSPAVGPYREVVLSGVKMFLFKDDEYWYEWDVEMMTYQESFGA